MVRKVANLIAQAEYTDIFGQYYKYVNGSLFQIKKIKHGYSWFWSKVDVPHNWSLISRKL